MHKFYLNTNFIVKLINLPLDLRTFALPKLQASSWRLIAGALSRRLKRAPSITTPKTRGQIY